MAVSAQQRSISVSIVSHNQEALVRQLLEDLDSLAGDQIQVILTINVPEKLTYSLTHLRFPITIIRNENPKGFAANHNRAFLAVDGDYFCVLNPDIRLRDNPFPSLIACLKQEVIGVSAPKIIDENGDIEDSARRFPTPWRILKKAVRRGNGRPDYDLDDLIVYPDWVGGMFMLFRSEIFAKLRGFSERFFLYYEDVDVCARLRLLGYKAALCADAAAVHEARRQSHRDLRYFKWHLASMTKFFLSPTFFKILWSKR